MPLVREPKPLPSELGYVAPGSTAYKVTTNDTWWTLADCPDLKFSKMTALDLCYFNFRTEKAHRDQLVPAPRGRLSYVYPRQQQLSLYLLRPPRHCLPPNGGASFTGWRNHSTAERSTECVVRSRWQGWYQFVVVGIETVVGVAVSLDDPANWMAITASISRIGPGFGASGAFARRGT